jgi:PAS domain S-box-containing protein
VSPDTAKARPSTVSEQVQSEKLRLEIAAIVKLSDDAILSQTLDGIITSWNPAATRLYGYTDDEIVGQSVARLIPPDRNYELEEILTELRCGRRVERYDTVRIRKDGTRIDVSITTSLLKNEHGTVVGASTLARDIGSRKATQAALDQSEKQYREFVETAHEAVWTTDADGNTSFVNAQMAEMIGYPIDEIVGRPLSGFMDDEGSPFRPAIWRDAARASANSWTSNSSARTAPNCGRCSIRNQ